MTYDPSVPAAMPAESRPRPATVTIASYLLYAMAALGLVGAILGFVAIPDVTRVIEDAYADTGLSGSMTTASTAGYAVGGVVTLLLSAAYVVLGILNAKGKNPARIVTWVLAGLAICCGVFGLLGNALGNALGGGEVDGAPDSAEIQRRIDEAVPWLTPVNLVTGVLGLILAIAVVVLLALPASNEFFRKPQLVWEPQFPGAYPAPGQPYQQPGQSFPPPGQPYQQPGQPYQQPGQSEPPYPPQPPA